MKPSHVRKRNFGATFADAVDKANADRLSDINDLGQTKVEETKGERSRAVTRSGQEREWERLLQRASVIKPRFKSPPPDVAGSAVATGLNATTEQQQPRGRIRLKGSFLGIYAKGNTTPRSPRTDDDVPQRPDKRERIRNLRIRRPFISDSGKTSTTTTKSTTSTSPRATSTAFTTTAPSSQEHSSVSSSALTSSEKIINLKGIVKEYKEIVRTSSTSTTTTASTTAERSVSTEAESEEGLSDETGASTATTKRVATTATAAQTQDDIATASTTTTSVSAGVSETLPNVESSENAVISSESESVSDRASTSLEPPSIQSAVPSSAASLAVTESKELPGSGDMKQSKTHNKSLSQSASSQQQSRDDITTRNPIEITRPREELQKDLLDAIRRKISRNKQQLAAVGTQISVNQAETEAAHGGRAAQQSNFISSTKNPPLFFRPGLSFPGSAKKNSSTDPRIKIFVNLPPGSSKYQDPTSVKIPNISHIRSKIERLNDAINTGLKLERIREKEKEALENDWRHSGVQKTVVRSQSSSVQIVSQKSHQDSVHNDQGNQETIRKQSLAPPSSKSEIKNQFESSTTTVGTTTTAQAQTTTTATTSTAASTTVSDGEEGAEKEKLLHEHPSSHFRPANWTRTRDFIPMPKSNLPPKEDVQLFVVTPKHVASYKPVTQTPGSNKHHDDDQKDVIENVVVGDQEPVKAEKDAEDITNTTIIVIAVISVIPVAGLVAWGVRTVLRRKVL